jgi:hypothetical protein
LKYLSKACIVLEEKVISKDYLKSSGFIYRIGGVGGLNGPFKILGIYRNERQRPYGVVYVY